MSRLNLALITALCLALAASIPLSYSTIPFALADDEDEEAIEELNSKIEEQRKQMEAIDAQIAEQQQKLNEVAGQKKTLQTEVSTLDASKNKIETSIKKTQTGISASNLTLNRLAIEVNSQEEKIRANSEALAESLRTLQHVDDMSPLELYLNDLSITSAVSAMETVSQIQDAIRTSSSEIVALKNELIDTMQLTEAQKNELEQLTNKLAGEKEAVVATKAQKDSLLAATKNKESEYQSLLQQKVEQRAAFEKALQSYEAELNIIINRDNFPTEGTAVLAWPLDSIRITQLFGSSEFAQKNPSVYGGRAYHPGTDFGASIGTTLKAPLGGTVINTGNTDAIAGCLSWGKWILLRHDNGLTSLFAHLSVIGVSPGDVVETGDVIGNTGNTGYSTGPHLHYTLYASEGVRVVPFTNVRSTTSCAGAVTPTAPPDAYLDPLDYLPKL